ncbi:ATPase, T2SS/T4P/T4SS family [Pirellulales bacterium]|nr:ATPase, T2SS/T4P/T4SS family [Pirellulales bacterium]
MAMRIWYNRIGHGASSVLDHESDVLRVGRSPANDVVLNSPFVASQAAILSRSGRQWEVVSLGENEIRIGKVSLRQGERAFVLPDSPIHIYPFALNLQPPPKAANDDELERDALDQRLAEVVLKVHRDLLSRMEIADSAEDRRENQEYLRQLELDIEEIARLHGFLEPEALRTLQHCVAQMVLGHLTARIIERSNQQEDVWSHNELWTQMQTADSDFDQELEDLVDSLERELGLANLADVSAKIAVVDSDYWSVWEQYSDVLYPEVKCYLALRCLKKQIKDIVFGYGPLEDLLRLPNITEIMVVDSDRVYIEKSGVLEKSGRRFVSDEVTVAIIERIVSRVGRRIDKSQPLVDARLADGSRVNAVIDPIAVSGPCLTIRKFPEKRLRADDLVRIQSLSPTVARFLRAAVISGKNVLISGGTGTGKTTLLNCLSDYIPDKERIITIEDTAELQLQKQHVVRMETKEANVEGKGRYAISDLVKNALRMRPDRVVVGECRGPEALDMLQAMNTGHDGSMTTIHANTARDCILRLEVLVQMAADLPVQSIHRQIASAIDLVVQLTRLRNGRRCVTQVTEFAAYDERDGLIRTKDIFKMNVDRPDAVLLPTGALPSFMAELIDYGLIDLESFYI